MRLASTIPRDRGTPLNSLAVRHSPTRKENTMNTTMRATAIAVALATATTFTAGAAFAETVTYKADLKGSSEVPPTSSVGVGTAALSYDTATKELTWTVTYTGLSGPATAAHFDNPATVSDKAPVTVPPSGAPGSPGKATLTDAQAADLAAGRMYLSIQTAAYPNGEVRGQVTKG